MDKQFTCWRCTMSFEVDVRPASSVEVSRCPDCGKRFWHYVERAENKSIVGIDPIDLPEWKGVAA